MSNVEELSREDLLRIVQRDRFVKEQLAARVGNLMHENLEMLGIVQELQEDLRQARAAVNGEVPTAEAPVDVTS